MKTTLLHDNYKTDWVNQLLQFRGVAPSDLEQFKTPTTDNLIDPFLLNNMDEAAQKIIDSIKQHKHFGLLFDSDCDGITSSTIIYHFLKEVDPSVEITYFFHDHKEHGLEDSWEKFIEAQVDIVLQPDSGINDKQYHDLLGEAGIETIVLDHHAYEGGGYSDYAIYVDNQTSPNYLNKSLAGCGVTWQCCRAIDRKLGTNYAFKYIDLVALGCAADVMSPLTLENRFIFEYGFNHIQDAAFKGLCDKQSYSMNGVVNYTSVAFYISPLINAAMRTGSPDEKLMMYKMFLHPERTVTSEKRGAQGETVGIIEECTRVLSNVKARQQRMVEKYIGIFESRIAAFGLNDNNIIIINLTDGDNFESELNGLIATKIAEKYHKPCLVIRAGDDGLSKGSARNPHSSPIADLKTFILQNNTVEWAFGHSAAFGLALHTDRIDDFIDWFNSTTSTLQFNENCYVVDFEVTPSDDYLQNLCWDITNYDSLWGGDNPSPVVSLKHFHINPQKCSYMGTKKDTIKIPLPGLNCMIFRNAELVKQWSKMQNDIIINVVGRPSVNVWMGQQTMQLLVDDIEWKEDCITDF